MKTSQIARAFTLIELLIVVTIIGILAAIAVPNFINSRIRAKVARVVSEHTSLRDAYIQYFLDRNAWPPHIHGAGQHRYTTTPVAYLSTSISDPFVVITASGQQQAIQGFGGEYHMEPSGVWAPSFGGKWGDVYQ
ncbi:MAG: type II secretion system protein, partial [bacterium]